MKKKLILSLLVILLSGCQLALPDSTVTENPETSDQLVGNLLVVPEPENPFVTGDQEATCELEGDQYNCQFKGFGGHLTMFYFPSSKDDKMYYFETGDSVVKAYGNISYTDEGLSVESKQDIYIINDGNLSELSLANVYFNEEKQCFYLSDWHSIFHNISTGGSSITYTQESKTEINGEVKNEKSSYSMTFNIVDRPEIITVNEFNSNNTLINQYQIKPNDLADELAIDQTVAYIVLDTTYVDDEGNVYSKRTLYDRNFESMTNFYQYDQDLLAEKTTLLIWG